MDTLELVRMVNDRRELDRRWSEEERRQRAGRVRLLAVVLCLGLFGGLLDWICWRWSNAPGIRPSGSTQYVKCTSDS